MNTFILGSHYDIHIINLKYTLFLFKKSLKILALSSKNSGFILTYITEKFAKLLNLKYLLLLENVLFFTDWLHGYLTNSRIFKAFLPNLILLTDYKNYSQIATEGTYVGIPTIGFLNSNMHPIFLDYFIPINTNSFELLKFYLNLIIFYLIVLEREVLVKAYKQSISECLKKKL